ncbi:MAG: bifunctional oligoribonuclease/PAP phosphatase NrnA [Candidatus Zixiibacteriota bacterium]|nr:MAG: bifunctional oligoribonuclease/PAP phosphatase NrnA [candidate division Zixibacteria bacterium]
MTLKQSTTTTTTDLFSQQAADFDALLGGGREILVTTHVSPDGDAVASLLAAAEILRLLGSRPTCGLDGGVPLRFRFLPGSERVKKPAELQGRTWDGVLVLDCGSLTRIGKIADLVPPEALLVSVDHHIDNTRFAQLNILYPDASSTTELLFDLAVELDLPLSPSLAQALYTGLLTDTGGFRFSNTSDKTFTVAARLAALGVRPEVAAEAVFCTNSVDSVRLLGQALISLELSAGGRVASMVIPDQSAYEELEEVADFAMSIRGVQVTVLFRVGPGYCRGSLRARGDHDVAHIARKYGGGGHQKAAGFTYYGLLEAIRAEVLEALAEEVEDTIAPHPDAP